MYNVWLGARCLESGWKSVEQACVVALSEVASRALCGENMYGKLEIRDEDGNVVATFDPESADWLTT